MNYVVSMRLAPFGAEGPDRADRMLEVLEKYPGTRFKLDPTNTWTPELMDELVATGAVDSLDLKGQYKGTPVDVETDPELYALLIETLPGRVARGPRRDRRDAADARRGLASGSPGTRPSTRSRTSRGCPGSRRR